MLHGAQVPALAPAQLGTIVLKDCRKSKLIVLHSPEAPEEAPTHLLLVAMLPPDLAAAAALGVLLHLDLGADLGALLRVDGAVAQEHLRT